MNTFHKRSRRTVRTAVVAVVLGLGFTCGSAVADSHSAPEAVPISAATQTVVTLNFTGNGCNGCTITPAQLVLAEDNAGQEASWNTDFAIKRKVRGDSVSFTVPTENTRGMSFMVQAPMKKSGAFYDAVPLVVFQYADYSPGQWVERAQAIKASHGSPCWSGTTESAVSLTVNVREVTRPGLNDDSGGSTTVRVPISWVAPTEQAFGGFTRTDRGIVAAQDVFPCGSR